MQPELLTMRLETERLLIRPYIESDLQESFELMQDPELFTYLSFGVLPFEEYTRLFRWLLASYRTPFDQPFKYSFAIRRKSDDALIGWCGVGVLDFRAPDKELYYLIGREYWGSGYAAEAASALTAYAFDRIGLERLLAKAHPANGASRRVIEKVGFQFQEVLEGLTGDFESCNGERLYGLEKSGYDRLRGK